MTPPIIVFDQSMLPKNQSPSRRNHQFPLQKDSDNDDSDIIEVIEVGDEPPRVAVQSPIRDVIEIDDDSDDTDDEPPRNSLASSNRRQYDFIEIDEDSSMEIEQPPSPIESRRNSSDDVQQPPPRRSWGFIDLTGSDSDSGLPSEKEASPSLIRTNIVEKLQPQIVTNYSLMESSAGKTSTAVARASSMQFDDDFDSSDDDISLPPRRRRLFSPSAVEDDRKMPSIDISHTSQSSTAEVGNARTLDSRPSATIARGSKPDRSLDNDVEIEAGKLKQKGDSTDTSAPTQADPMNELLLSEMLSAEKCDLLAAHDIYTPSQLVEATNITREVRDIASQFRAWHINRTGMEALMRMRARRTSQTHPDKATSTGTHGNEPAKQKSSTTNGSTFHRAAASTTAGVRSAKKPQKEGAPFPGPIGRPRIGMEWDSVRGIWKKRKIFDGESSSDDETAMETEMTSGGISPSEVREHDVLFGKSFQNSNGNRCFREFVKANADRGIEPQQTEEIRVAWQKKSGRFLQPARTNANGEVLEWQQAPTSAISRKIYADILYQKAKRQNDVGQPSPDSALSRGNAAISTVVNSSQKSSLPLERRQGAWTVDEKKFAEQVIRDFRSGVLNVPSGTALKECLAAKLQCDPARITKQFQADLLMSRRTFQPALGSPSNAELIENAQAELEILEQNWRRGLDHSKISEEGITRAMSDVGISSRRKRNDRVSYTDPEDVVMPDSDFLIPYSRSHSTVSDTPTDGESSTLADEDIGLMNEIGHLTRTIVDPRTGYPVQLISVFCDQDETIYDFTVQVRKSRIPNAGLGAFLTFVGARVLKPECKRKADEKMSYRELRIPETMAPLEAEVPEGFGVSVKLTGSNLHGNQNSKYWPLSLFPFTAMMPDWREIGVKLSGAHLHYDSEDEEEPLNLSICPKRIGHLGIHIESDYVPLDSATFSNRLGLVDLGRYGPVLKNDRKSQLIFDMKNFLFDYEPACWNFGVEERLHGCEQIVDITDDATGEPHECARHRIHMYVNEVGHNKKYKQNVLSREHDGRSVHYYFNAENALKKGETVELMCDYFDQYEDSRERKGYGIVNLEKGVRGDDHQASRLERNLAEREEMENLFKDLTLMQLFELVEFLHTKILGPVVDATGAFIAHRFSEAERSAGTSSFREGESGHNPPFVPSCRQWIARRRMHWASERLEHRTQKLMAELEHIKHQEVAGSSAAATLPCEGMLFEVQKWLRAMKWNPAGKVMEQLLGVQDASGKSVRDAIVFDMSEEILFTCSSDVIKPLNEAQWCPIASELTKGLCEDCICKPPGSTKDHLAALFFARAKFAAAAVQDACNRNEVHNAPQLHFVSSGEDDRMVNGLDLEGFVKQNGSSPFSIDNSTIPKGVTAALADIQAYRDAIEVGFLEETFDASQLHVPARGSFVIAKHGFSASLRDSPSNTSRETTGIPRKLNVLENGASVDETWYLLWQVVYIVHAFASKFLMPDPDMSYYSLERLCQEVDVDFRDAQRMMETGISTRYRLPDSSARKKGKRSAERGEKKSRPRLPGTPVRSKLTRFLFNEIVWKALEGEGWTVIFGNRPTDYYFLPPGVVRGKGFKPRVDFFDSIPLVMNFIRTDARWKDKPAVVECLKLHSACGKLIADLKSKRHMPKGELKLEWLLSQLNPNRPEQENSS